jgi:pyridinium-3,5-bisthiocarboxylic acid mononucleotide nickel chelatase
MGRVMYLDCFSGAAGDMMLGALIDAGLPVDELRRALGSLGVGHEIRVTRVLRAGISATHVEVEAGRAPAGADVHDHGHAHGAAAHDHDHGPGDHHRSLHDITHLIEHAALSAAGKARAVALFRRLAEVEAAIHGVDVEAVHLHEVGALDSIIDIVGAVFGLEWFGIDDIVASPLNVGGGTVQMAHGTFPVPAPATIRLLAGVPVYSSGVQAELVTPTGALLVTGHARAYGPLPAMTIDRIGYGAGTRELDPVPNVLRVFVGSRVDRQPSADGADGEVVKIECEIDDMSPQLFGPVSERLFAAGALDVFLTPVQMKKGRPGTLLTVLGVPADREALCGILFRETTTLGVRFGPVRRETLDRRWVDVAVDGGSVRIKIGSRGGEVVNVAPEFDDCLRIADQTGRPVKAVQAEAIAAWRRSGQR